MQAMTEPVVDYRDLAQLDTHVDHIRNAPSTVGTVDLIVSRQAHAERTVLDTATLDLDQGLAGDSWSQRPSRNGPDGGPDPDSQLNIMSSRAIAAIAGDKEHWHHAGDQFFLDVDLSHDNLPTGSRLRLGDEAVIEITAKSHNGCAKFRGRYGLDAMRWVNGPAGKELRIRGLCAKVIVPGIVHRGDKVVVMRLTDA